VESRRPAARREIRVAQAAQQVVQAAPVLTPPNPKTPPKTSRKSFKSREKMSNAALRVRSGHALTTEIDTPDGPGALFDQWNQVLCSESGSDQMLWFHIRTFERALTTESLTFRLQRTLSLFWREGYRALFELPLPGGSL
jgi:hypothetical protein